MSTVNDVAVELIIELDENSDDSGMVTKVETMVNNALDEIAIATDYNHFKDRANIPTVASQAEYQLPVGAREIIALRYTDTGEDIPLKKIQELAFYGIRLEETGRAACFIEDGIVEVSGTQRLQIRLAPVPDSILTIEAEYYYHPSDVLSAGNLPIQDQLIVPLKYRVKADMHEMRLRYDASDRCQRKYEQTLSILIKKEQKKAAHLPHLRPSDLASIYRRTYGRFPAHYEN